MKAVLAPLAALVAALATGVAAGAPTAAPQPAGLPASPVGAQLHWVLAQVNGGAKTLTEADVRAHFAPSFLRTTSAAVIVKALKETAAFAPVRVQGLAGRATPRTAIVLVRSRGGGVWGAYATVERRAPHRLTSFNFTEPPDPGAQAIATPGRYSGAFPVGGGRTLYLNCSGSGGQTVILEAGAGGGSASWQKVQRPLSKHTRVCSYDRANVPGGSSSPVPKPQTAADVVRDLHRALRAANVPQPYVFAGFSNGGLYARLYATTHPRDVAGLVLVDSISEQQPALERALAKKLMSPAQWRAYLRQLAHRPPFVEDVGDEQVDIPGSYRQMRAAARTRPLPPMPLVVIRHGIPDRVDEQGLRGLAQGIEQNWQKMQRDLACLVPGGRLLVARKSHHQIPQEQPALVVSAIRQVLSAR
jgi:pimeloyl-ACP methyl ester carboxylesterase